VYTYLLYNISWYFKTEDLVKLYQAVYRFSKLFTWSRHPTTICWVLEILHLMSIKFPAKQVYHINKQLKKDFNDHLTHFLSCSAAILSDTYYVNYFPDFRLTMRMIITSN
jgi:hypothetical protein